MTTLGRKMMLWCRFCQDTTDHWVDNLDDHKRVCTTCWRRAKDGVRVDIQDGARMTAPPRRDSRPPSVPPPALPPLTEVYVTRHEYDLLLTRVDTLERAAVLLITSDDANK